MKKWKELKRDTKKAIVLFSLSGVMTLYITVPPALNSIALQISPKLQTKSQIEEIINQEKKYHGFNEDIEVRLNQKGINSAFYENGKNVIRLNEGDLCEASVRHEAYHIMKKHMSFKKSGGRLLYFTKNEPMTSAYTIMRELTK